MNSFEFFLKVKIIYWFWIVKYGGKKKIPPEVVFGRMNKSMDSLFHNIQEAIKVSPENMDEEERMMARELLMKTANLRKEMKDLEGKE